MAPSKLGKGPGAGEQVLSPSAVPLTCATQRRAHRPARVCPERGERAGSLVASAAAVASALHVAECAPRLLSRTETGAGEALISGRAGGLSLRPWVGVEGCILSFQHKTPMPVCACACVRTPVPLPTITVVLLQMLLLRKVGRTVLP